jgi:hypothetical protein
MSYIGNGPPLLAQYGVESFNGGGTSFTLSKPATTATVLVFIDGVRQTPTDAYSVSGVTLTTTATTPSGTDNVTVQFLGDVVDFGEPSDDSVSTAKIQDDAVTAAKLANSINTEIAANTAKVTNATHTGDVTGATALTIAADAVDIAMLSATGTADATTFLRGDNAWAAAGGGKVLQVITATDTTASSVTSGSWTDTALTASITCAATTSKVLVWATAPTIGKRNDDWQYNPTLRFKETVTTDVYPTGAMGFGKVTTYMSAHAFRRVGHLQPGLWLHSPSSTSALTYTLQMKNTNIDTAEYCETTGDSAVIVLMEIGA